jgi:hypothetical protein
MFKLFRRRRKMLKIYGHSDDLVEIEGVHEDEIGCYDQSVILMVGTESAGVIVEMNYENDGCWSAKLKRVGEGCPIPWNISIVPEQRLDLSEGYSIAVKIDCPAGVPVRHLNAEEE